jgi:hypothetical protein
LHLEYLYVSENLLDEVLQNAEAELVGDPENVRFDAEGYLEGF